MSLIWFINNLYQGGFLQIGQWTSCRSDAIIVKLSFDEIMAWGELKIAESHAKWHTIQNIKDIVANEMQKLKLLQNKIVFPHRLCPSALLHFWWRISLCPLVLLSCLQAFSLNDWRSWHLAFLHQEHQWMLPKTPERKKQTPHRWNRKEIKRANTERYTS